MSRKDLALALLVPCLLGFGFVIAKPAMESFPPILLNGLRWSLSGLLMCYFFPFPKNFIKQMFFISLIGVFVCVFVNVLGFLLGRVL